MASFVSYSTGIGSHRLAWISFLTIRKLKFLLFNKSSGLPRQRQMKLSEITLIRAQNSLIWPQVLDLSSRFVLTWHASRRSHSFRLPAKQAKRMTVEPGASDPIQNQGSAD